MLNALSIDVEDYFQVSNFENSIKREDWDKYECRVVANTRKILSILSQDNTKATFFVLGWIAERFPELVKEIDAQGHEVASHGYSHRLIYRMSKAEFKDDLAKSLGILEQLTGKKVLGYRAASCSITNDSLWALDILKEENIKYDSSVFPIHHDRYGIPKADRFIHKWNNNGLVEFPFSTVNILGQNIPVAGGGYFRLYPYCFTKWAIKNINRGGHPTVIYIHPWEFDSKQPRIKAGLMSSFRHYTNVGKTEDRLKALLRDFKFTSVIGVIKSEALIA